MPPVTLQSSLAPSDHRIARKILPHQIRTWRGQVAEILLTIDLHRNAGRFAGDWEEGRNKILALARNVDSARVVEVDYNPPDRCADFHQKLPDLIRLVETGAMPATQLGFHDVGDSLVDWSEARTHMAQRRWWKRLGTRLRS